ncbi:MAG: hypothetical protein GY944_01890 [bacterium]|nr:hypothetical protein [bacterium]
MTTASTHTRRLQLTAPRIAAMLSAVALASWGSASIPSFHFAGGTLKLLIAGLHLVAIGRASASLLHLRRPAVLASAHDALLGQVICLAYVYLRSLLSDASGIPGICAAEVFAAEGLLFAAAWWRSQKRSISLAPSPADCTTGLALHALWLGWLFVLAFYKLDLYFTPSSDPDIHAYYARTFLERGQIYYDLLPQSDSWMVYPSAFGSLNFVWGRLSGLHPVQLVNTAAYVQLALFAGATFSLLATRQTRRSAVLGLAALHFAFVYVGFNAVFADHRAFLEGTPRLAHTALLFFPLWFALQHRNELAQRAALWLVPALGTAIGACVNPTHVPAVLLLGAASWIVVWPHRATTGPSVKSKLATGGAVLIVAALLFWTDPFYRELALQRTAPEQAREAATDLTGAAIAPSIDPVAILGQGIPDAARRMAGGHLTSAAERGARRFFLAALVLVLGTWLVSMRGRRGESAAGPLASAAFAVVGLHAIWAASTPFLARPGVLQTRLLVQYSRALQEQLELLFLALVPTLLVTLGLELVERRAPHLARSRRRVVMIASFSVLLASSPFLAARFEAQRGQFYDPLRSSPLGAVYASDAAFARQIEDRVEQEERVLLPGRLRRLPGEHWVFTTDAGRAIPLFGRVRTSFFLGLDGWAFTAGAYEAHVEPPRFDPDWLRANNVVWLVDSGSFPQHLLRTHYEPALRSEHALLWRLKPREVNRGRVP